MAAGLHISLSAEKVAQIGPLVISNSILTSLIVSVLLIALAFYINTQIRPSNQKPSGIQNIAELFIEGLYNLIYGVTGSHKKTRHFFPLIATFFFFIMFNNYFGLLPGVGTIGFNEEVGAEHVQLLESNVAVSSSKAYAATPVAEPGVNEEAGHTSPVQEVQVESEEETHAETEEAHSVFVPYLRAGTADLNTTLALALISVFMTQVFGVQYLNLGYFKKYFNFSSPIMFFVGILELVSEVGKVISFAFRLFGNIFAGEVLLAVIGFLVALVVPMPFYGLEFFVGFVQALVFALLSTVFFNLATTSHDDH
jgi:F-type H+-transporting ATPase subunit a